jgi:hypothetical protein
MDLPGFRATLTDPAPPPLSGPLRALWWAAKGGYGTDAWNQAHKIAQADEGADAAWVHAYLHRVEGDLDNARYWYRRAGKTIPPLPLAEEWTAIAAALLTPEP